MERGRDLHDSEHPVCQTVDSLLQNQKSATGQEQALQDETMELLLIFTREGVA